MEKTILNGLVLSILFITVAKSQSAIIVNEEPKVSSLMNQYIKINKSITHISGWRVTVITTSDRRVMEQTKSEFQRNFNFPIKWEYKEPYYHLKAGAFLNKNDALFALESIKKKFSSSFISLDKIAYSEL